MRSQETFPVRSAFWTRSKIAVFLNHVLEGVFATKFKRQKLDIEQFTATDKRLTRNCCIELVEILFNHGFPPSDNLVHILKVYAEDLEDDSSSSYRRSYGNRDTFVARADATKLYETLEIFLIRVQARVLISEWGPDACLTHPSFEVRRQAKILIRIAKEKHPHRTGIRYEDSRSAR